MDSWGWVKGKLTMASREGAFVIVETPADEPIAGRVKREAYDTTLEPRKVLEALARA